MVKIRIFLILTLTSIVFVSCSNDKKNNSSNKKIFRYNESHGISSLDPAFTKNIESIWACNHLYNGLVQMDENLEVKASIAKKWKISGDGKTYTFHLRNDVYFHDHFYTHQINVEISSRHFSQFEPIPFTYQAGFEI